MNRFSYREYRKIVDIIRNHSQIVDYRYVLDNNPQKFCIFRHDVEFSVERAYRLAKFEYELDLQSSYFFQITNNNYNILSDINLNKLKKIKDLGHNIGVHVFVGEETNYRKIVDIVSKDIETLSMHTEVIIDRFSFHRPNLNKEVLRLNIEIDGIINAYGREFFTYFNGKEVVPEIKYISDSQHRWNYGNPLDIENKKWDKLQLLLHEYSWTENGFDNIKNFNSLIVERNNELLNSMNNECKHFPKELLV